MINIKLTEEEAEVVSDYIFRKVCRLEDAKLEDSYCYQDCTVRIASCPRL